MLRAKQAAITGGRRIPPANLSPAPRIGAFPSQTRRDRLPHPNETDRRRMIMDEPATPKQPAAAEVRTKGRLTRSQVAARLGVSISKVRTMEGKALHPNKIDGVNYFDPSEVDAVAKSQGKKATAGLTDGQIAAKVFDMIDHGKELREIVIELEIPPAVVRGLYREWLDDFDKGEERRRDAEQNAKEERAKQTADRRDEAEARALERHLAKLFGGNR